MATQSPFPFLDPLFDRIAEGLKPPPWVVDEAQRRLVLVLNHVLMQEPEAQSRLVQHAGRVVEAHWRSFVVRLVATPAGLLDLAPATTRPDLTFTLTEASPWGLVQAAVRGDKPPVRVAGDVQFAAEINWLVDHVRWDVEEDLSRVIGDVPAHALGEAARRMLVALRQFARGGAGAAPAGGGEAPASPDKAAPSGPGPGQA